MNKRADQILVDLNLFESRTKAQAAIDEGLVKFKSEIIEKSSSPIDESAKPSDFEISSGNANKFVSRGGLKLEGALKRIGLDVRGLTALDVGQSTGGFSECLLHAGIESIVGVDVGTNQLHATLKNHPKVKSFENTHIRDFKSDQKFDLIVIDVSFISLKTVLPFVIPYMQGSLLALVKPQFELDATKLGKNGIVKEPGHFTLIENSFKTLVRELGLTLLDYFESPILGKDGNKEFFIYVSKDFNGTTSR